MLLIFLALSVAITALVVVGFCFVLHYKKLYTTALMVSDQRITHYQRKLEAIEQTYHEMVCADNWLFGHRTIVHYLNCRYVESEITQSEIIDIVNNDTTFPAPFHQSRHARIWLRSQVDEWFLTHYITKHVLGE